ncbi:hypothetical protein CDAR_421641 [Caerostris darwini]|uniref:Uncharacterized protein n=1 Tax=Caerostris darwini TaxID=1538125 RepID=A0AAV4V1H0_9ARAC|nr:hypothetical protein CDAR_421641 [Caerostris darwini]
MSLKHNSLLASPLLFSHETVFPYSTTVTGISRFFTNTTPSGLNSTSYRSCKAGSRNHPSYTKAEATTHSVRKKNALEEWATKTCRDYRVGDGKLSRFNGCPT